MSRSSRPFIETNRGNLCIFLVVLFSIAVIGHGIWVMGAAIIPLFGVPGREMPPPRSAPLRRLRPAWRAECEWCGLACNSSAARELADLAASHRQIRRLLDSGVLASDAYDTISAALKQRHDAMLGKPALKPRLLIAEEPLLTVLPADEPVLSAPEVEKRLQAQADIAMAEAVVVSPEFAPAEPAWADVVEETTTSASMPLVPLMAGTAPVLEAVPTPPRPPRRSMLELLSAFMEQSNILWGELVGGLLIVVCSIALVISLWPKLEENPAYQFLIFASVTTMLFGAGLYTFHHWKLEATSRGLLVISTLLVPLNFLAIAAQTKGVSGPLELTIELFSLLAFAVLLHFTGRVLVPDGRFWFPIAVLGTSASQTAHAQDDSRRRCRLGDTVVARQRPSAVSSARLLRGYANAPSARRVARAFAAELFVLLGTSTFAIAAALGLLVSWNVLQGGDVWVTLARLAIVVALAALPLLAGGVTIPRCLNDEGEGAPQFGGLRTAATAIALVGMFAMLTSVALAWPVSLAVLAVCTMNFGVLTYLATRQAMPFAHGARAPLPGDRLPHGHQHAHGRRHRRHAVLGRKRRRPGWPGFGPRRHVGGLVPLPENNAGALLWCRRGRAGGAQSAANHAAGARAGLRRYGRRCSTPFMD